MLLRNMLIELRKRICRLGNLLGWRNARLAVAVLGAIVAKLRVIAPVYDELPCARRKVLPVFW